MPERFSPTPEQQGLLDVLAREARERNRNAQRAGPPSLNLPPHPLPEEFGVVAQKLEAMVQLAIEMWKKLKRMNEERTTGPVVTSYWLINNPAFVDFNQRTITPEDLRRAGIPGGDGQIHMNPTDFSQLGDPFGGG